MTGDVWYTTSWSHTTHEPTPGHEWLTNEGASEYFLRKRPGGLDVIDAHVVDAGNRPRARWAIDWGGVGARVRFFTEAGSTWRTVDWELIDGRLWRWITIDWTYPDDTRIYRSSEAILDVRASARPDGTGDFTTEDVTTGQESFVELTDAAKPSYWIDVPTFGDWTVLADPGPSPYEVAGRSAPAAV